MFILPLAKFDVSPKEREKSQNTRKNSMQSGRGADKRLFILLRWNRDVERTVVLWEVGKAREEDEKEWEAASHK